MEADPSELEGYADTPLSDHLHGCERCRAAAGAVLEGQAELANAIAAVRPGTDADSAIARAVRGPRSVAMRRARWLVPLAAAAALGGILLMNRAPERPAGDSAADRVVPEIPARAPGVAVEAPEGRDVLVFETDDPTVTVGWFF